MFVPVVDKNQTPLMPTTPSRARRWIKEGKATPFWKKGLFCVRLNVEPSGRETQTIAVGIDPGSKKEALTVKSEAHTYLNIQADAVTWVKKHVEQRRMMRKARRSRKTPCRANRMNRARGGLPPSTKARWQWKLRLCRWLAKMFPISQFVVEDIKARTTGQRKWDRSFSPLEVGKHWFYEELQGIAPVETKQGWETKELRDGLGLKKSKAKLSETFSAHCVDSWVLANWYIGGQTQPDNTDILFVKPLQFHRRQLHVLQPPAGGIRKPYGGTRSLGFTRGSLVKHPKYGLTYVGGYNASGMSLHRLAGGKDGGRVCRNAKPTDLTFLAYASWLTISKRMAERSALVKQPRQSCWTVGQLAKALERLDPDLPVTFEGDWIRGLSTRVWLDGVPGQLTRDCQQFEFVVLSRYSKREQIETTSRCRECGTPIHMRGYRWADGWRCPACSMQEIRELEVDRCTSSR